MEWQVGQWVDYRGEPAKIEKVDNALTVRFANGSSIRLCLDTEFVKPFQWQVGRTYKTTLEGVTVKLAEVGEYKLEADDPVRTSRDNTRRAFQFHAGTGRLVDCEDETDVPHLLPFLADEPSEPEPTLTERYTLDHDGGPWWLVRDNQRGKVLKFASRDLAEHVLKIVKSGEGLPGWKTEDVQELDEPEPVTQPKSRYHRTIKGVTIDLYDIAKAYGVKGNPEFHALKKIIMAGDRGYKDRDQDLQEAIDAIQRARELAKGGAE